MDIIACVLAYGVFVGAVCTAVVYLLRDDEQENNPWHSDDVV